MSGLSSQTIVEWEFIAFILEGFFYGNVICSITSAISSKVVPHYTGNSGIYSGIFFMHLQYQGSKKCVDKKPTTIFYSVCTLYVLSVTLVAIDIATQLINVRIISVPKNFNLQPLTINLNCAGRRQIWC